MLWPGSTLLDSALKGESVCRLQGPMDITRITVASGKRVIVTPLFLCVTEGVVIRWQGSDCSVYAGFSYSVSSSTMLVGGMV